MPGARLDDARPPVHTETEVSNSTAVGAEYGVFAVTLVAITLILARWADRRSEPPSRAELMRQSANRFKWSSRIEAAFGVGRPLVSHAESVALEGWVSRAAARGICTAMASSRQLEAAKLNVRAARRTGRRPSPSATPPQDSRRGSNPRDLNEARRHRA